MIFDVYIHVSVPYIRIMILSIIKEFDQSRYLYIVLCPFIFLLIPNLFDLVVVKSMD